MASYGDQMIGRQQAIHNLLAEGWIDIGVSERGQMLLKHPVRGWVREVMDEWPPDGPLLVTYPPADEEVSS